MADTITFEIDAKQAAELDALLEQFIASVDRICARAKESDEEYERRQARMDAVGRHTDEMIEMLKQKLAIP